MDITPEQRARTHAVAVLVEETDWDGDITPHVETIVELIGGLVAEDPGFLEFAKVIYHQSVRWSLAAFSESGDMDSGWSRLADQLEELSPTGFAS